MFRSIVVSSLAFCLSAFDLPALNLPGQMSDDFNNGAIDTSTGQVILPLFHSCVVDDSGTLTTTGRGLLATQAGMPDSLSIDRAFPSTATTSGVVISVPEPRTYAFIGIGLLCFWFLERTTRIP